MRNTGVVRTYGQSCPIARGAEIFAERWTPLIIRNLYLGCGNFSEILEGAPGLSRTSQSSSNGSVSSVGTQARRRGHHYELTSAGHDLFKVCVSLGEWGTRHPALLSAPRPPPGFHRIRYYGVLGARDARSADQSTQLATAHGQYVASTFGFAGLVRPLGLRSQAQTWSA